MPFRVFSCAMVLLLLSMPCLTLAQQTNDAAQAIADAKRDAKNAPYSYVWYPAGCILGVAGILIAVVYTPHSLLVCQPSTVGGILITAVYTPHPPPEKLLGKSPEYTAYYTSTYQQVAKYERVTDFL